MIGISWPQLLTSIVSFTILAFLLYRFLYGPLSTMMRERAEKIKNSLAAADQARADVASAHTKIEEELQTARKEAASIVADARSAANQLSQKEHEKARSEVQEILAKAQREIDQQKLVAIEEVRQEFGSLAVSAAEKIIRTKIDAKTDEALIDSVLADTVRQKDRLN